MNDIEDKFKDLDVQGLERKYEDTTTGIAPIYKMPTANADLTKIQLEELLGQKKFYGTYYISSADPVGKLIFQVKADYDFASTSHFGDDSSTLQRFFNTYRYDYVRVIVEMVSMYQHQGAVAFIQYNYPDGIKSVINANNSLSIPENFCKFPRAFQVFGSCPTLDFKIHWNSNLSYFPISTRFSEVQDPSVYSTNPAFDNGSLQCLIFDPLQVATGVPGIVQLRVWTQLVGLRFGVYEPRDTQR